MTPRSELWTQSLSRSPFRSWLGEGGIGLEIGHIVALSNVPSFSDHASDDSDE